MLVGIVADIRKGDDGHFICEVMTHEIAEGLDEALSNYRETGDPEDPAIAADVADANDILDFLSGPLGHAVRWTLIQ